MGTRDQTLVTSVFVDIRDFTTLLNKNFDNDDFFRLVESVYSEGLSIATELTKADEFYINSTGDGFLCIFHGPNNHLSAFFFSLLFQKTIHQNFVSFFGTDRPVGEYYYGIGLESGYVRRVASSVGAKSIETFLGNVINLSARLESLSKEHFRAPILYGPLLNDLMAKEITRESYSGLMSKAISAETSERAKQFHQQMSEIDSRLLSSYLFEHRLKGVE